MASRITSNMLSATYLSDMRRNLGNMQTLQAQLSSGKEIQKASDNPYKTSRSMQLNTEISYNKQYNENIKDTSNWLDTTDTALAEMGNVFGRIETLLVNAGNGSYGEDERTAIQDEIKEKVNQLSQILNTSFDGSYIFGGTKTNSKPTTVVDGVLQYADKDGNEVKIIAYKDSAGNIKNDTGSANTAISLTDEQKQTLLAERDNADTSIDRKEDITKILQGDGNAYTTAGGVLTSEKYENKEITLSATDITKLQKELEGLDYNDSGNDSRINEINSLLYNTDIATGGLPLTTIKNTQQALKLNSSDPGYPTQADIKSLNAVSKADSVDQINSNLEVDISQGVKSTYNKTAIDVLEFQDKNGKTINVSNLLSDIINNLGKNGDTDELTSSYLTDIQSVTANLLQQRSEVGSMQNRMDSAQSSNETQNYNMTDILSKTEDIDFTEKTMQYSIMQTVYTAALQTSAKILPMTILNYL